jgi:hypothetical protein
LLAGFLDAENKIQGGLFHDTNSLNRGLLQAHRLGSYAEFP